MADARWCSRSLWTIAATLPLVACASRTQVAVAPAAACATTRPLHWASSASERPRTIQVWLESSSDAYDRALHSRLREALEEWNDVSLPVHLTPAASRGAADIQVNVISRFPDDSTVDRSGTPAGLTQLTHNDAGEIIRARVIVAVATPWGVRYTATDRQATLLHELGHALGLPHARSPFALMAQRTEVTEITGDDVRLARASYGAGRCGINRAVAQVTGKE